MTQLLISVTTIKEAQIALENGADFIDLKDPSKGALGALPLSRIGEIVTFVSANGENERKLTSATIGDLPMEPQLVLEQVVALAMTKVDIIKIGFFKEFDGKLSDYQSCLDSLKAITQTGIKLIAVLFAEYEYPASLILAIKNAGFYGVMLDTVDKNGATFLDYFSPVKIKKLAENVQAQGLLFGLAGSLNIQHVAVVKKVNPDYIGFRGGVCADNQRKSGLDAEKIRAIRKVM